ncbi:MAG: glutamate--tRNA ligase [Patescibacteria group bacterium]
MINLFKKKVVVRFPPSPTGPFHVGSARTALFNFLFTRKNGGKCLLRIEDTDKERSKSEFEKNILDSLNWLGLKFDGDILKSSERTEVYKNNLKILLEKNKAYISKEEEGANKEVVRFRNPGGNIIFQDLIRGEVAMDVGKLGDFIIARNINEPLYHLAVVSDDIDTGITHIIRGEDLISSTPRQILLIEALGGKRPIYAHLPLLLDEDRSKLSKRKQGEAVSLDFYRKQGYLPEALVNFLALLGWNPGDEREIFSMEELIKEFSLEKVQKSGAIFDIKKLDWMNGEYIRKKSLEELVELAKPFVKDFFQFLIFNFQFSNILKLEQPRLKKFSELPEKIEFFFKTPEYGKDLLSWKGMSDEEIKNYLEISKEIAKSAEDFTKENLEKIFMKKAEEAGDRGKLLWPLRVALSGRKASPGPFDIMAILGKEESLERIKIAVEKLM